MKTVWLGIFLMPLVSLFSGEHSESELSKFYVDAQGISFENGTIMVHINDKWSPTNSLFSDEKGFFILRAKENSNAFTYECWYCKYPIPFYRSVCERCNSPQ